MRVLFTSPILEHPAAGGPQLRIENSIKALSAVCELDIISGSSLTVGEAGGKARDFYRRYCKEFESFPRLSRTVPANRYLRKVKQIVRRLLRSDELEDAAYILDHVDRRGIDVVWFGYGNISFPLIRKIKQFRPDVKVVCDTDSVWSRFILRELPYAGNLARKFTIWVSGRMKEAEEKAWVNLCDATTAVSEVDAAYYQSVAKDHARVHVFSNVIDVESYREPPSPPEHFKKPSIYLAGSFGDYHAPMNCAARWVLEEVLPLVWKDRPDVHFYIIGRNSEIEFGHLTGDNITVTGRLESVLPYLCNTDVALVPLKFESGTRFKILEAGACNIPLVSTTLGAEGIPVVSGEHILLADDPGEFAGAIVRLLENREFAEKLANKCHDLVNEKYSVESLTIEAKRILGYLNRD